jgi:hypothetical protein
MNDLAAAWAVLVSKDVPAQDRLDLGGAHQTAQIQQNLSRLGVTLTDEAAARVAEAAVVPRDKGGSSLRRSSRAFSHRDENGAKST